MNFFCCITNTISKVIVVALYPPTVNAANSLYATAFLPGSITFLLTAAYGSKGFLELSNKLVQDKMITQDILIFGRCSM